MRSRMLFLPLLTLIAWQPCHAHAGYIFTKIADSTGTFGDFGNQPSVNAAGTVAFQAGLDGTAGSGVFVGGGGSTSLIADTSGSFNSFGQGPAISVGGLVAFFAGLDGGQKGVFRGSGGPTTTIYDSTPLHAFSNLSSTDPGINAAGTVVFHAQKDDLVAGRTITGIYSGNGGAVTTIAETSTTTGFLSFGIRPSINDSGTVALTATRFGGGSQALITSTGGVNTVVVDTATSQFSTLQEGGINAAGAVAFRADLDAIAGGGSGIFMVGPTGLITTVATTAGAFSQFPGPLGGTLPSINGAGTVAFYADLDAGGGGIFTGPDPVANRVIGTGDVLDGRVVNFLGLGRFALNDTGSIAFEVVFAGSGGAAVYRADLAPTAVPEPSSLALLGIGAAGLAGYARRRKRMRTA